MEKLSNYVIALERNNNLYLFNTKNNISICVDNKLMHKLEKDEKIISDFENFLKEKEFFSEENELTEMIRTFQERDNECLRIVILAHGNCNFRCKYCYEKFSSQNITNNIDAIYNFIIWKVSEGSYKELNISWFGGEPLLGYKDILELSNRLIKYAQDHNITYLSDMTTNGYLLTDSVFKELVYTAKVKNFQITIDGSREGHDYQRVLRNGNGTYERIIDNLKKAAKTDLDFSIIIRLNVSKDNYIYINDFLLNDGFIFKSDKRFCLIFRNVGDWGNGEREGDYFVERFENDISYQLSLHAIELGYRIGDIPLGLSNNYICYAQRRNSYVIDTNGNILKCTVDLYGNNNNLGSINNPDSIDIEKENLWINEYYPNNICTQCNLWLICKGGSCPHKLLNGTMQFNEQCKKNKIRIQNMFELAIKQNYVHYYLGAD